MAKSDKVQKSVSGHAWTICCLVLVCGLGIQTIVNNCNLHSRVGGAMYIDFSDNILLVKSKSFKAGTLILRRHDLRDN